MDERDHMESEPELRGTERLRRALRDQQKEHLFVPTAVDDAILSRARPQLRRIRAFRNRRRAVVQWLAVAAAIAAALFIVQMVIKPAADQYAREDFNRDGQVDILDAFQLARMIQAGAALPARGDLNKDGRIDDNDVDIITRRSVSIGEGGPS